jgi:nucleoside-diphosphate kinase
MSADNLQKTLILVKPDGVQRGLIGEVIGRFEKKGFRLCGLKLLKLSRQKAEQHYAVHLGKPFYESLLTFITSAPLVAMVLEGPEVIAIARKMMGATRPLEADNGSIRGDFASLTQENIVHGSDSPESAAFEIPIYFEESELV